MWTGWACVLKAGADYQAGTVLESEEVDGDPTGFAVPYVGAETAVILCRHVDATDAAPPDDPLDSFGARR